MPKVQSVVAAVITPCASAAPTVDDHRPIDPNVQVLLSKRRPGKHLAGLWEFPGGRIEPEESPEMALRRELKEELGIEVTASTPWCTITHHYPEKSVQLIIHRVTQFSGVPSGLEGQAIAWVPWQSLPTQDMPPADHALLKVFGMAPFAWIAPQPGVHADDPSLSTWAEGLASIAKVKPAGHPWWVSWPLAMDAQPQAQGIAAQAMAMAKAEGHVALIAGHPEIAVSVGADGVYLDRNRARALSRRPSDLAWVAMACHDAEDLQHATQLGVDFVTLAPLRRPAAEPEQIGLGGKQFAQLMQSAGQPVLALGGLGVNDLAWVRSLGGFGVAGIHSLWGRSGRDVSAI